MRQPGQLPTISPWLIRKRYLFERVESGVIVSAKVKAEADTTSYSA